MSKETILRNLYFIFFSVLILFLFIKINKLDKKLEIIADTQNAIEYRQAGVYSPVLTYDFFSENIPVWQKLLRKYQNKPNLKFLEIGVLEGRATCWLFSNILKNKTSKIDVIDIFYPFNSLEEAHKVFYPRDIKSIFLYNTAPYKERLNIYEGFSDKVLPTLLEKNKESYDFIYIDANHSTKAVYDDATLSFPLLKKGGIMLFDDYLWYKDSKEMKDEDKPKIGIDRFVKEHKKDTKLIHKGYQLAIEKL